MIELVDITRAAARLQGQVLHTPCVASKTLSDITGAQVYLKFENLQFTASFKERGACNKLAQLVSQAHDGRASACIGVVAMSAGNHAQGVAYHAQRLGLPAVIVMPSFTPGVKVERTPGFWCRGGAAWQHAGRGPPPCHGAGRAAAAHPGAPLR